MIVLVAEDDRLVREMLDDILREEGHVAVLASNGREAWVLLNKEEKFDLVISDNDMSEMGGIELLQQVRANPRTADTPFILMSGDVFLSWDNQTPLEEVCGNLGATFLEKPFSLDRLLYLLAWKGGTVSIS